MVGVLAELIIEHDHGDTPERLIFEMVALGNAQFPTTRPTERKKASGGKMDRNNVAGNP